jgi:hypothetical protein
MQRLVVTSPTVVTGIEMAFDVTGWPAGTRLFAGMKLMCFISGTMITHQFSNDAPLKPTSDLQGVFAPSSPVTLAPGEWWLLVSPTATIRGAHPYEVRALSTAGIHTTWWSSSDRYQHRR